MARKPPTSSSLQIYVNLFSRTDDDDENAEQLERECSMEKEGYVNVTVPPHLGRDGEATRSIPPPPETGQPVWAGRQVAPASKKLCGYLNKRKVEAKLKRYYRRWFVFVDNTCKLLYYRTPQDMIPLGEIDISCATLSFSFDVELSKDSNNIFQIRAHNITYLLEADDRQTMMYWLQELQKKRHQYCTTRSVCGMDSFGSKLLQMQSVKLLPEDKECSTGIHRLLDSVERPEATVGETASESAPGGRLKDLSLGNLKTEIKNFVANRKNRHRQDSPGVPSPLPSPVDAAPIVEDPPIEEQDQHRDKPAPGTCSERDELADHLTTVEEDNGATKDDSTPVTRRVPRAGLMLSNIRDRFRPKSINLGLWTGLGERKGSGSCAQCKQLIEAAQDLRDENNAMDNELTAYRDVLNMLQKHVLASDKKLESYRKTLALGDKTDVMDETVSQIVELQDRLSQNQDEKAMLESDNCALRLEVASLKEEIEVYHDSVTAKDEMIMAMTRRLDELEGSAGAVDSGCNTTLTLLTDAREVDRLKDQMSAYVTQNRFLCQEILELNRLREADEAREKNIRIAMATVEAEYYKTKSRYLLCLKNLDAPRRGGSQDEEQGGLGPEVVKQMLQDAMETEVTPFAAGVTDEKSLRSTQYDQYGFLVVSQDARVDVEARVESLTRRSDQLLANTNSAEKEVSTYLKWENYLASLGDRPLSRTPELKALIRMGIPSKHRKRIWMFCVDLQSRDERAVHEAGYYTKVLRMATQGSPLDVSAKQIELDLLRTLPNHKNYEKMDSESIPKLRNILSAFAAHNPDIGYCQGLNRLAAIALLFLEEEEAFWCLVAIVEYIMPNQYYSQGLVDAHVDQRVMKDLTSEKVPKLHSHLISQMMDISLFTFNWFMTIFVDNIPVETYLRIWDVFLFEGSKVLFRFAVAAFKWKEEELLQINNSLDLHRALRCLGENLTDINTLAEIAFNGINPFPMKTIVAKRQLHRQRVQAEMEELQALRQSFHDPHFSERMPSTRARARREMKDALSDYED